MNKPFEEVIKEIVVKEIEALTPGEKLFLKSRSSYLTEEQREKYSSIINPPAKKKSKK